MNVPTYCRTSGKRIGACKCYRCRPIEPATPPKEKPSS